MTTSLIILAVFVIFVVILLAKTVRIIPQARAGIVERFGKYRRRSRRGSTS
jgi:regulator of protease activity HflC (stomatin/prohibitin superfamily)